MKYKKKKWKANLFRYTRGMYVQKTVLPSIGKAPVPIPDPDRIIHLQFRRFAGCPVCNLHLRSFVRQSQRIKAAGIHEIIVFHSEEKELIKYTAGFPFSFIADPGKQLYRQYGVGRSIRSLLMPKAMLAIVKGVANSFVEYIQHKRPLPVMGPKGGSLGLPADFLIASDGKIIDCHYGRHADDQWSVTELLEKNR